MTRDDITRMAWEAGFVGMDGEHGALRRFAALVADAEAKRIHDEGMVTVGHMRERIAAERERAALQTEQLGMVGYGTLAIAAAIRKGQA